MLDFVWVVDDVAEFMGFVTESVFGVLEFHELFGPPVFGVGTWFIFGNVFRHCLLNNVHE